MTTKTISITEEAYNILKEKKSLSESFSEVLVRLSGKKKLSSFYGALSEKSADKLEKSIKDFRKNHKLLHERRLKK